MVREDRARGKMVWAFALPCGEATDVGVVIDEAGRPSSHRTGAEHHTHKNVKQVRADLWTERKSARDDTPPASYHLSGDGHTHVSAWRRSGRSRSHRHPNRAGRPAAVAT